MIWIWVAIAIVVAALVAFVIVALGTARRLTSLQKAINAPEVPAAVAAVQGRMAELQIAAADVQARVATTQERLEKVKSSRSAT
jgi:uncharacterized membrane protein